MLKIKDIFKFTPFLVKFTPFHAEPIRAQLENLPAGVIELIKEHTREGCEFNQKSCELKNFQDKIDVILMVILLLSCMVQ
jgi:hypothetical protein